MDVSIAKFEVEQVIKNKGIVLSVANPGGGHRGNLLITKTKVIWCPGKTKPKNGHGLTWEGFIARLEKVKPGKV